MPERTRHTLADMHIECSMYLQVRTQFHRRAIPELSLRVSLRVLHIWWQALSPLWHVRLIREEIVLAAVAGAYVLTFRARLAAAVTACVLSLRCW